MFARTAQSVTELIAYAERRSSGHLNMVHGDLEDASTIHEIHGILSSQPFGRPVAVDVTTTVAFKDDRAERRIVPIVSRMRNVYATDLRASDLERRENPFRLTSDQR